MSKLLLKLIVVCVAFRAPEATAAASASDASKVTPRRILIIYEVGTSYPAVNIIDKGIRTALDDSTLHLEVYREYMDTLLFPDPATQQQFRDFYLRKYKERRPDVIITVGPSPLKFMEEAHRGAFAGIPVIFCLPNGNAPGSPNLGPDFTGVENDIASFETIAVALRLQPHTEHVVVVGGTSAFDRQQASVVKEQLKAYEGKLQISYLTELAMPTLLDRLQHLPKGTVVLLTTVSQDSTGRLFIGATESGPMITAASSAPVFTLHDVYLNHGFVGGYVSNLNEQGRVSGSMALRILDGEKPQNVPRVKGVNTYIFDWRAMKHWGLKQENLPAGSILLNRQFTVWELYKSYIIFGLSLVLLEAALISALLWQRSRRQKAETQRQLAAEALSRMSRKLIRAQEQERKRIARELHDDLGQELAFMKVTIDGLLENSHASLKASLTDLSTQLSAIAETTREISHGLYPTQLEYLGLPKALSKLCDEIQHGKELSVRLRVGVLEEHLQPATSLSLYRVAQETLHNIVTHSRARSVHVELTTENGQILLRIVDNGIGFDVNQERSGLGLASMRERVLALGGSIEISSSQTTGTTVEVRVPLHEASANLSNSDRSQMR